MKRFSIALLLVLSLPAFGASLRPADKTITAKQKTALAALVKVANAATCDSLGLPATCTQPEAAAKNPSAVIHTDIDAYATWVWSVTVDSWLTLDIVSDQANFCERFKAKTASQRNDQCVAAGETSTVGSPCTFGCK